MRLILQMVLREDHAGAAERVGFDDVGAGFEILAMDIQHHIRPRLDQVFIATFKRRSTEIRGGQIALLQHRAHGAIEHQDAGGESVVKGSEPIPRVGHNRRSNRSILAGRIIPPAPVTVKAALKTQCFLQLPSGWDGTRLD